MRHLLLFALLVQPALAAEVAFQAPPTAQTRDGKVQIDFAVSRPTDVEVCILSAGGIPPQMRQYCDLGTPWLKETASMLFNGEFIGDVYAGAVFDRELSRQQRERVYFLRELTGAQLDEAYRLGVRMAGAIRNGVKPYDPAAGFPAPEEG